MVEDERRLPVGKHKLAVAAALRPLGMALAIVVVRAALVATVDIKLGGDTNIVSGLLLLEPAPLLALSTSSLSLVSD
jgi:hypothetical protein